MITGTIRGVFLGFLVALCAASSCSSQRDVYYIPQGGSGWYGVVHEQSGWPLLDRDALGEIHRFGNDGILLTASPLVEASGRAEFYFVDASGGRMRIQTSPTGGGGLVWGRHTESLREAGYPELTMYWFFIGSEAASKQAGEEALRARVDQVRKKLKHAPD